MLTSRRLSLFLLSFMPLLPLTGCIAAAAPMVKRERGPNGLQLAKNAFDPLSVKVGVSTREEVLERLFPINTGVDEPQFFWGRWATSKWGYGVMTAAESGDAGRIWGIHNFLITFDEHGIAQTTELIDDGPPLWREIIKQSKSAEPIDMSTPISLTFMSPDHQTVTFSPTTVDVVRPFRKIKIATFSPDKIRRVSHTHSNDKRNHAGRSCHVLHLSEKTAFGQEITFCADGPDLFDTFRYLHQYAPADMKWE